MTANEHIATIALRLSPWERLARAGWYGCAAIASVIFLLSIPAQWIPVEGELYRSLAAPTPSSAVIAMNIANFLGRTTAALISLVLAGVLFFKRPDERMALFLSYFLLVFGTVMAGPLMSLESFWPGFSEIVLNVAAPILFAPFLVAFLSVFPNGRFEPGAARWLVGFAVLYGPLSTLLLLAPAPPATMIVASLWFALIVVALSTQIYRYFHVSNNTQRQQTKWVVYGFTLAILIALFITTSDFIVESLAPGDPTTWLTVVGRLGWPIALAVLPISLGFAVMRYRLYEIDIIINRTLVYGALTVGVVVIYALSVGTLGVLFQVQGNLVITLLATGLVAVLFQPLRERLQRAVNRLIYGERDEPFTVLRRLGRRLESSGTPEDMLPAIVETIAQTLKLPYAAIALRRGEVLVLIAQSGNAPPEVISFPIQYQGEAIGSLDVGPRSPGEALSEPDNGLLRQVARQAGPVAFAYRLAQELRQSHTRLVTARDEERRRLRRDLHDGLGPVLASQGLKIAAVGHLLEAEPERARNLLDELAAQNEATVSEIRRLVYALRPPELDELGLVGAVRRYTAGLDGRPTGGVEFRLTLQPPDGDFLEIPSAIEAAAYRIAAEALTNVARHAGARFCTVSFLIKGGGYGKTLHMEITDDGSGFSKEGKTGIGLNSMRERAEEAGGSLSIVSDTNRGTTVTAEFSWME